MADLELEQRIEALQKELEQMKALAAQASKEATSADALEKPPVVDKEPVSQNQGGQPTDNAPKELQTLAAIKDDAERAEAIKQKAGLITEQTGIPIEQTMAGLSNKVDALIAAHAQPPSTYVSNFMPKGGQATVSAAVGQDGFTGGGATLQTPSLETDAGSFAAFANGELNADGDLQAAGAGLKYVSPAFKSNGFTGVGIGVVSASSPLDGKDFDAGNIGITAGAAVWLDKTGTSLIPTVSTNGNGDSLVTGLDFSQDLFQTDDGTVLSAHFGGNYDVLNDTGGVAGGVIAKTPVNRYITAWAGPDITVQNLFSKNDWAGLLKVGLNFGANNAPNDNSTKLDHSNVPIRPNEFAQSVVVNPGAGYQSSPSESNVQTAPKQQENAAIPKTEEGNTIREMSKVFYALKGDKQQAYLADAAKVFSENSGVVDLRTAKEIVLNAFQYEHDAQNNRSATL